MSAITVVKFNSPAEFVEELKADAEKVDRGIVRVTQQFASSNLSPNVRSASIVATARIGDQIIRLDRYCGDLWGMDSADEAVQRKLSDVMMFIDNAVTSFGLTVRPGVIEPEKRS